MNTRVAIIMAETDLGASGTKIIDINIKDVISRITVQYYAVNADTTLLAHPAANIEKLEVVDGSDVLFSLSGAQAQGLNFYDRNGKIPYTSLKAYASGVNSFFSIDFGRFLFDPVLAFDPKKFRNPQLKITFDRTKANAACVTSNCTVRADIFDELEVAPTGFLMAKDIYSYTVGVSGYEYIDMPTDYITQQIYAKAFAAPYGPGSIFDEFKLSEDNDKRIPLDLKYSELERRVFENYGYVSEHAKCVSAGGAIYFYGMPTTDGFGVASLEEVHSIVGITSVGGGHFRFEGPLTAWRGRGLAMGLCPHGVFPLLPKPGPEIADWYNVTKIGSLKLRIKQSAPAATGYTGEIIIKQYRPYAAA